MRKLSDHETIMLMMSKAAHVVRESAPSASSLKAPKAPIHKAPIPMGRTSKRVIPRPHPSQGEAAEFLLVTRLCTEGEGKYAIALFTGEYDAGAPYGAQLDSARAKARKVLATPSPKEYTRSGVVSAEALLHTPGMPNPIQREIDHLIGVRRSLTAELCEQERAEHDTSIVEAKLCEINRQIDRYGLR